MHLIKSHLSVLALILFTLLCTSSLAQSSMEYGIGIGVLYGDYHENSNLPEGFDFDIDEAQFSPSINLYSAYRVSDKVKFTVSPGFNFLLHREPFRNSKISTIYLHAPVGLQYRLINNLSVIGSIYYDFLVNQSIEFQGENRSITDQSDTRHLFGANLGIAYSIGRYVEIQLTANHQFNTINTLSLIDSFGNALGNVKLKNRFLKLNLIFRG